MIVLEPISTENALVFKTVRLRALKDSPLAFGSTYAKESQLPDEEWHRRSIRWSSDTAGGFLAMEADRREPCGLACVHLEELNPEIANLVSMWVAPSHRRLGAGRSLIRQVQSWGRNHGATILQLMVTSCNDAAIAFYKRNGFSMTGKSGPYPNDASLQEYEMAQPLFPE